MHWCAFRLFFSVFVGLMCIPRSVRWINGLKLPVIVHVSSGVLSATAGGSQRLSVYLA